MIATARFGSSSGGSNVRRSDYIDLPINQVTPLYSKSA
jgi:hypothetical protein